MAYIYPYKKTKIFTLNIDKLTKFCYFKGHFKFTFNLHDTSFSLKPLSQYLEVFVNHEKLYGILWLLVLSFSCQNLQEQPLQCGEGTELIDNVCVSILEEAEPVCPSGMELIDDACVTQPKKVTTSTKSSDIIEKPITKKDDELDGGDDIEHCEERNLCGGCGELTHKIGEICGTCGKWICDFSEGELKCNEDSLSEKVGKTCEQTGMYICDSGKVTCKQSPQKNECGSYEELTHPVGEKCGGKCGTGAYQCNSNNTRTECVDPLAGQPMLGGSCSTCGIYVCNSENTGIICNSNSQNMCGGCASLAHTPGEFCGACGKYTCSSTEVSVCNDPGYNECGGCDVLTNKPNDFCGTCGKYTCNFYKKLVCSEDKDVSMIGTSCTIGGCNGSYQCNNILSEVECITTHSNFGQGCGGVKGTAKYACIDDPNVIQCYDPFANLPDSGQEKCYAYQTPYSEATCSLLAGKTTCSSTPGCGQDAEYFRNTMSLTVINDVVKDNITGLYWEKENSFGKNTHSQAKQYCDNLTKGGYSDWRLPNIIEIFSVIDFGSPVLGTLGSLNENIFPKYSGYSEYNWSSTWDSYSQSGSTWTKYKVFMVYVSPNASIVSVSDSNGTNLVRCVRNAPLWGLISYETLGVSPEQIVVDHGTELYWQKNLNGLSYTWVDALSYCESLNYAGYNDWRLPNIRELGLLMMQQNSIPITATSSYWSSTTSTMYNTQVGEYALTIVYSGNNKWVRVSTKNQSGKVVCVRN